MFITVFTAALHWILHELWIQFIPSHHVLLKHFNVILPSTPKSSK
jgi:hypothetical protein